jgi:hypothetical protein
MSQREAVLQQALALPTEDRAYVASVLERSLGRADRQSTGGTLEPDGQGDSSAELQRELERRSAAYRAGSTTARSAAEVLADLNCRQDRETQT